jgi:hypothetical protein
VKPVDVVVAVPAHDEAATIAGCLDSVVTAVRAAQRAGVVTRARVAVAAHRCSDATFELALASLTDRTGIEPVVRRESTTMPVGAVRTRLIEHAISAPPALGPDSWVLSTDADTIVPVTWVTGLLSAARDAGAELVLGLADLEPWAAGEDAHRSYRRIVEAGIRGDQHHHAYAANLAVSWSAFRAVQGFPSLPHGEEHGLAVAVRDAGLPTTSPLQPRVQTSARMPGRAAGGLGDLLADLAAVGRRPLGDAATEVLSRDGGS